MAISPIQVGMSRADVKTRLTDTLTARVITHPISTWADAARALNVGTPPEYQIRDRDSGVTIIAKTSQYHFIDRSLRTRRPTNLFWASGSRGGWFTFRQPEHVFKDIGVLANPGDNVYEVRNMVNFGNNENAKFIAIPGALSSSYQYLNDRVGFIEATGNRYRIDASSIGTMTYYTYAQLATGEFVKGSITSNIWTLPNARYTNYLFINRELSTPEEDWLRAIFQRETWVLATGSWLGGSVWNPHGLWP